MLLPGDNFPRDEPVFNPGEPRVPILVQLDLSRPVVLEAFFEPGADSATAGLAVSVRQQADPNKK